MSLIINNILNKPVIVFSIFIVNGILSKILILNFLRIIKKEHNAIYKKFGEPPIDFAYPGRDVIVWWKIISSEFFQDKRLNMLKVMLITITLILLITSSFILYGYIKFRFLR